MASGFGSAGPTPGPMQQLSTYAQGGGSSFEWQAGIPQARLEAYNKYKLGGSADAANAKGMTAAEQAEGAYRAALARGEIFGPRGYGSNPFLTDNGFDKRAIFSMQQQQVQAARQQEAFDLLKKLFGGGGDSNDSVLGSFQAIQDQLDSAQKLRADTFTSGSSGRVDPNIGKGDVQYGLNQYKDMLAGPDSLQRGAARENAMQGLQGSYLSSLRNLRSSQGRGVPAFSSNARASDLLSAKLQAQSDVEKGLITDQLNRQQSLADSYNQILAADISRQQSAQLGNAQLALRENIEKVGNPELGASLKSQYEQALMQQRMNILSQLKGIAGI